MLDISSKENAHAFLRKLINTNNNLLTLRRDTNNKLKDIQDLEKDSDIGLILSPKQKTLISNKTYYEKLLIILDKLTEDTSVVEDIDETIKLCVENVFLERKSKKVEKVDEKEKEKVVNEKVKKSKKEEVKAEKQKELVLAHEVVEEEGERVPFAWKSGLVYSTVRERQRDNEKNKTIPAKEYRAREKRNVGF